MRDAPRFDRSCLISILLVATAACAPGRMPDDVPVANPDEGIDGSSLVDRAPMLDAPAMDRAESAAPLDGTDSATGVDSADAADGSDSMTFDVPVPTDIRPVGCRRDTDCAAAPGTPYCNLATGMCAQCLRTTDLCPAGSYCGASNACVPGCRDVTDCMALDAGMACDPVMHQCFGCLGDGDCALGTLCTMRSCVPGCSATHACPSGSACCGGMCMPVSADIMHCGSCTGVCGNTNASPTCVNGACNENCATGFGDCDSNTANGCETATTMNAANCGRCGNRCALANASSTCTSGACAIVTCTTGFLDCDGMPGNGCEANTQTDPTNCNACGTRCRMGELCTAGACACPSGQSFCGTACIDTSSDPFNCGACNIACPAGQMCLAGACGTDIVHYTTAALPASVQFVEICTMPGVTPLVPNVDDAITASVPMPFPFRFFDGTFNSVVASSNGWITFGAMGTNVGAFNYGVFMLPTVGGPRPAFYVYSADLHTRIGECFTTIGTAPNRQFVWEINDSYRLADAGNHLTIETFFNERSNTIDVIYQTITGNGVSGENANVGMQNAAATRSFVYEYLRLGSITPGLRVRFVPGP